MAGSEEFARLTEPFRAELLAHCYRMLGSVHDAEDQVQETLVRAWRSYGEFEGRSSLRTWLYRIATNACLRAMENRGRRPLPSGLGAPGRDPEGPLAAARPEVPWLQPIPDALVSAGSADPAEVAASRAERAAGPDRRLAVPARPAARGTDPARRAGLAGGRGRRPARHHPAAVNSLLQRARARLGRRRPAKDEIHEPADPADRSLLDRYAAAFENADVAAVVQLLREDAVFEMPPEVTWFTGRELIGRFLQARVLTEPGRFQMTPVAANGQPALAAYLRDHDGVYRAHSIACSPSPHRASRGSPRSTTRACSRPSACLRPPSLPRPRYRADDPAGPDGLAGRKRPAA